jgi:hypothetical protein
MRSLSSAVSYSGLCLHLFIYYVQVMGSDPGEELFSPVPLHHVTSDRRVFHEKKFLWHPSKSKWPV